MTMRDEGGLNLPPALTETHHVEDWRRLTRTLPSTTEGRLLHSRIDRSCEDARRRGEQDIQLPLNDAEALLLAEARAEAERKGTYVVPRNPEAYPAKAQAARIRKLRAALVASGWTLIEGLRPDQALEVTLAAERQAGYNQGHNDGQEMMLKAQQPEADVVAKATVERWLKECRKQGRAATAAVRDEMADRLAAKDQECRDLCVQARNIGRGEGLKGLRHATKAARREATIEIDARHEGQIDEARREGFNEGMAYQREVAGAAHNQRRQDAWQQGYEEGHAEGYRSARWAAEEAAAELHQRIACLGCDR